MSNLKPFSNTYTPTYLLEKLYSQVDDIKYMAAIVVRKDGTYSLSCSDLTLKDAAFLKAILDEWMMASMRGEN